MLMAVPSGAVSSHIPSLPKLASRKSYEIQGRPICAEKDPILSNALRAGITLIFGLVRGAQGIGSPHHAEVLHSLYSRVNREPKNRISGRSIVVESGTRWV